VHLAIIKSTHTSTRVCGTRQILENMEFVLLLVILKIKELKTTNRDRKKVTKQGSRYSSVGI